MIILYISKEACGPAMLESALIDKFSSSLVGILRCFDCVLYIYIYT